MRETCADFRPWRGFVFLDVFPFIQGLQSLIIATILSPMAKLKQAGRVSELDNMALNSIIAQKMDARPSDQVGGQSSGPVNHK
jgi:hypothetical protein